jgi:thymidylate kinase
VLLRIDPEDAAARAGAADRFEDEGLGLQRRVADAYERLADAAPERWHAIDAMRGEDKVHADVLALVERARSGAPA